MATGDGCHHRSPSRSGLSQIVQQSSRDNRVGGFRPSRRRLGLVVSGPINSISWQIVLVAGTGRLSSAYLAHYLVKGG